MMMLGNCARDSTSSWPSVEPQTTAFKVEPLTRTSMDDAENPAFLDDSDANTGYSTQADLCAALKSELGHLLLIVESLHLGTITDLKDDKGCRAMLRRLQRITLAQSHTPDRITAPPLPGPQPTIIPENYGSSSSLPNVSRSPLPRSRTGVGNELPVTAWQTDDHPSILTIYFLTGTYRQDILHIIDEKVNQIMGAQMVTEAYRIEGIGYLDLEMITLVCDSKESGELVRALIQSGLKCKHLWTPNAQVYVCKKGEPMEYILALSLVRGRDTPQSSTFSDPCVTLLPTLQQKLSAFVGDVDLLEVLSSSMSLKNPRWHVVCKGDPERLQAFFGPRHGDYVVDLGFPVHSGNNLLHEFSVVVKALCLFKHSG